MTILRRCEVGNKLCGKRCIPQEWTCKADSPQVEESRKGPSRVAIATGIAAASIAILGVVAFSRSPKGQATISEYEADLNISEDLMDSYLQGDFEDSKLVPSKPDFTTYISPEDRREIFGLNRPPISEIETAKKLLSRPGYKGLVEYTSGDDILSLDIYPQVGELLKARNLDLSKIHIVEVEDSAAKASPTIASFMGTMGKNSRGTCKKANGETLIYINKTKAGMDPLQLKITRSHELIHAIQSYSGWVMDDSDYNNVINNEYYSTQHTTLDGHMLQDVDNAYHKQFKRIEGRIQGLYKNGTVQDPYVLAAARDIARRIEFEAFWICNFQNPDSILKS